MPLPESFKGQIIIERQEEEVLDRPEPYIISLSVTGDLKIGWSQEMKSFKENTNIKN